MIGVHTYRTASLIGVHTYRTTALVGVHTRRTASLIGVHTYRTAVLIGVHTHRTAALVGVHTHRTAALVGVHTHVYMGTIEGQADVVLFETHCTMARRPNMVRTAPALNNHHTFIVALWLCFVATFYQES